MSAERVFYERCFPGLSSISLIVLGGLGLFLSRSAIILVDNTRFEISLLLPFIADAAGRVGGGGRALRVHVRSSLRRVMA